MLLPLSAPLPAGDHRPLGTEAMSCPASFLCGSLQGQARGFWLCRLAPHHQSQFNAMRTFGFSIFQQKHTGYLGQVSCVSGHSTQCPEGGTVFLGPKCQELPSDRANTNHSTSGEGAWGGVTTSGQGQSATPTITEEESLDSDLDLDKMIPAPL